MVKAFAWSIAKRLGQSGRFNSEYGPGEKWWTLFKLMHPQLSLRRYDPLDRNRAEALNSSIVNEYYDLLHTVLSDMPGKFKIVMKHSFHWIILERRLSLQREPRMLTGNPREHRNISLCYVAPLLQVFLCLP